MQHLAQPVVAGEADIFQRLIETGDRALVHLLVRAVAAVNADDRRLVTEGVRVGRWPTERLRPVRGKALGVLRMESVAERMAHHLVVHHPRMPRAGQAAEAVHPARGVEDRPIHAPRIAHALGPISLQWWARCAHDRRAGGNETEDR